MNVPSPSNSLTEEVDGKQIRSWSVKNGVQLITDFDVLSATAEKLQKNTNESILSNFNFFAFIISSFDNYSLR